MSMQDSTKTDGSRSVGVDASPERRPGIPMEIDPPQAAGNAHWAEPERQPDPGTILKRKGLEQLTPVFGNTIAPRGLSGLMRRAAYEIPEHHTSHWLMLLLADRIDAIEHGRLARFLSIAVPVVAGGALVMTLNRRRQRRQVPRWLAWVR